MYVSEKHFEDFGPRNIALIVLIAVILAALAWSQRPIRLAAVDHGTSLNSGILAVDNNSDQGQVLGASAYSGDILNQLDPVDVKTIADNSSDSFNNYVQQLNIVLKADNADGLLNASAQTLNKDDQDKFIADLERIAVPSDLAEYHKLLANYYKLRFTQQDSLQTEQVGVYISAVSEQLDKIRQDFLNSASLLLP